MAAPQLEIEKKVDELQAQVDRQGKAISTMASWLVQAQTGFSQQDASGIEKILRGEEEKDGEASKDDT